MKTSYLVLFLIGLIYIAQINISVQSNSSLRKEKKNRVHKVHVMSNTKSRSNLNKLAKRCNKNLNSSTCKQDKACGWCNENNKCYAGSSDNLKGCAKANFYQDNKDGKWSFDTAGTVNINTGGKLVITKHPDLSNVLVNKSFK